MRRALLYVLLVGVPLALAVALSVHPPGGEDVFEGVSPDAGRWVFVHTAFLLATPLLALAAYVLLRDLSGTPATVSRVALVFFVCFYTAYEVTVGLGTGVLVEYANGLPPAEQAAVGDAIQHLNRNDVLGDPLSVSLLLGFFGWVVAMLAAAVAFKRAGAGWPVTILVGLSALVAVHPPPVGPIALVCFAAGAVLIERRRAAGTEVPRARTPAPLGPPAVES